MKLVCIIALMLSLIGIIFDVVDNSATRAQPINANALFVGHSLIHYDRYIYDQTIAFGINDELNGHDVVCGGCALFNTSLGASHYNNPTTQDYMRYFLDLDSRTGPGAAQNVYDAEPPLNNPPVIPDNFDYVVVVDHVNNYFDPVSDPNRLVDSLEWIYDFARTHDPDVNFVVMIPWGYSNTFDIYIDKTYEALDVLADQGKYFHVAPVGDVLRRVYEDDVYNIDYLQDEIHPNAAGEYIRMATFYATLTGGHPGDLDVGDSGLSAPQKAFVDATVWTVVHQCSFSLVNGPDSSTDYGECNLAIPTPSASPSISATPSTTPTITPTAKLDFKDYAITEQDNIPQGGLNNTDINYTSAVSSSIVSAVNPLLEKLEIYHIQGEPKTTNNTTETERGSFTDLSILQSFILTFLGVVALVTVIIWRINS